MLAALGTVFVGTADLLHRGGFQASLTVLVAILGLVLAPRALTRRKNDVAGREPTNAMRQMLPAFYWLFLGWMLIGLIEFAPNTTAFQNALVYLAFAMTVIHVAASTTAGTGVRVLRHFERAGLLGVVAYFLLIGRHGLGTDGTLSARSVGWATVLALSASIPYSMFIRSGHGRTFGKRYAMPLVLVAGLATTLSRTALAISLFMFAFMVTRSRQLTKTRLLSTMIVLLLGALVGLKHFGALDRRFSSGDNATLFGISLNTSGRQSLWRATWDDSMHHLLFGRGVGSADRFVKANFPGIGHPHNDYLRLIHDFGIPGALLWAGAIILILVGAWRRYRQALHHEDRAVHLAAVLGTSSILLAAFTDNLIISLPAMVPLGVLIGISHGRARLRRVEPVANNAVPSKSLDGGRKPLAAHYNRY